MARTRLTEAEGKVVLIEVINPVSVCCDEALLVAALVSVGVRQHPRFPFEILEEEVAGQPLTRWRWVFRGQSKDGLYQTSQLVKWWRDPAWLAANPSHEFAVLKHGMNNMAKVALAARTAVPFALVRRGELEARIPVNASPEKRARLLERLAGK